MKIAFFDSGIGGLTVLKEALTRFSGIEFLYFADTKNVPYGIKEKSDVIRYVIEATEFIQNKKIDALVVACNTATSVAINELRKLYDFPIVGMEPAIKPAVKNNKGKKILIIATSLTLNEAKLNTLISSLNGLEIVNKMEMDQLVDYAEKFELDSVSVKNFIKKKIETIDLDEFEAIVLGCTHFLLFKEIIREVTGKNIKILDGNHGTINQLERMVRLSDYKTSSKQHNKKIEFYSSGILDNSTREKELLSILEKVMVKDI